MCIDILFLPGSDKPRSSVVQERENNGTWREWMLAVVLFSPLICQVNCNSLGHPLFLIGFIYFF